MLSDEGAAWHVQFTYFGSHLDVCAARVHKLLDDVATGFGQQLPVWKEFARGVLKNTLPVGGETLNCWASSHIDVFLR